GLLAELGPERGQALVRRRRLQRPPGPPFLARIVDVVVGGVDLVRARPRVPARPVLPAEPADVHLPEVVFGLAMRDPVGHQLANTAGPGDPVGAESSGDE